MILHAWDPRRMPGDPPPLPRGAEDPVVNLIDLDTCAEEWIALFDAPGTLEHARARSFLREVDRRRYRSSWACARAILALYTGQPARELAFERGPRGKPALAGASRLCFSLSRSGALMLLALHGDHEVGVDLERADQHMVSEAVLERVLGGGERRFLGSLPAREQSRAFLQFWTLKEAVLKATGEGLSRDPVEIQIDLSASPPVPLHLPATYPPPEAWSLSRSSAPAFVAASAFSTSDRAASTASPPPSSGSSQAR